MNNNPSENESNKKTAGTGNKKKKVIIIAGSVIALIFLIICVIFFILPDDTEHNEKASQVNDINKPRNSSIEPFDSIWPMDKFVVALAGMSEGKKLIVRIKLDLVSPDVKEELSMRSEQIRNYVEQLLLGKTIKEISTTDGKIILRNEIIRKLNNVLETGNVRNIYFTEFLII